MTIWQQLQTVFGRSQRKKASKIDAGLVRSVQDLAEREHSTPDEVVISLLNQAVQQRREAEKNWEQWQSLTSREKQITALICYGLTSKQMAERLVISPETIKTHVRHILRKFDLHSRQKLRQCLAGWDFNDWLEDSPYKIK